ncbi:hypothetical protein DUNSADRAFT_18095 [Dunaliella salina]|uniref:GCK domain-containing protein n=1 Tax=Dunaliella salina TaxID=3046 RepID=A0ABQ7G0P9_DUNSA|nr:hypothetical protein DUNSADRAFT_18095 [Dunaliella salina]|eukprot:KAF5828169.1 hypothetical protein DUNSADRAFT_18095 [Dunaliella salina]
MAQQDDEKRQGTIQREEDCVECKIFGQGICLRAFQEFDKCFEDASAQGLGDDVCMDKVLRHVHSLRHYFRTGICRLEACS